MKPRSAINKGLRFENHLLAVLKEQLDANTHRVAGSGSGLDKNDLRLPSLNTEIEAKNAEQVHLVEDFEQVKRQTTAGTLGVLAIRNPKKPEFEEIYIVINFGDWITLMAKQKAETKVIQTENPKLKYPLQRLKDSINQVLKEL